MISTLEYRLQDLILRNKRGICLAAILLVAIIMRIAGMNFISLDMERYLIPWYHDIKSAGGLQSLSHQVGDYGLLYQTLISFMTYIDIREVYQYKILSIAFDFILAFGVYRIVASEYCKSNRNLAPFAAGLLLLVPTFVLNSSYWGQCDSMYSFFCLATLYYLYKDSFARSFVCLGLAFACKLQAIFICPFIFFYYFKNRKFSVLYVILTLAVFWMAGTLAYIEGRSLLAPIEIYRYQTQEYASMSLNFPSFWVFMGPNSAAFKGASLILTGIILLIGGFVYISNRRIDLKNHFHESATWFVWTMLLFLPSMHDRYAYLLDLLLIIQALNDMRYMKYAALALTISLLTYGNYLFSANLDVFMPLCSLLNLVAYIAYSKSILRINDVDEAMPAQQK